MLKAGKGSNISIVSIGGITSIGRGHAAYGIGMGAEATEIEINIQKYSDIGRHIIRARGFY